MVGIVTQFFKHPHLAAELVRRIKKRFLEIILADVGTAA